MHMDVECGPTQGRRNGRQDLFGWAVFEPAEQLVADGASPEDGAAGQQLAASGLHRCTAAASYLRVVTY